MTSPPHGTGPPRRRWVKAHRSDSASTCVEVLISDSYFIRDSKNAPDGPVLDLNSDEWAQLCRTLRDFYGNGRPTRRCRTATIGSIRATVHPDGYLELVGRTAAEARAPTVLTFTPIEYYCFVDGIRNGEFNSPVAPAEV